jgi:hypothetical protein
MKFRFKIRNKNEFSAAQRRAQRKKFWKKGGAAPRLTT